MNAIASALSGMQSASLQLDTAANDVANTNTPGFVPALGGLVQDLVAVAQSPILYAADAKVVRAVDQATSSLLDVVA